jgi:hypothetical protein
LNTLANGLRIFAVAAVIAVTAGLSSPVWAASPQVATYTYIWKITSVGGTYVNNGLWNACVTVKAAPYPQAPTCYLTSGVSVSNYVTGTVEVPDSTLSAAVGWTVTWSGSISVSDKVSVPAHQGGTIKWSRTFYNRNVTQEQYLVLQQTGAEWATGNYAHATPRRFRDISFQFFPS